MQETTAVEETNFDVFEDADFEEQPEEPVAPEKPPEEPVEEDVVIKYMGKETPIKGSAAKELSEKLNIPYDEIPAYIQKGMNYDRAIENTALHKTVKALAEANGQSYEEFVKFLDDSVNSVRVSREVEALRAKFPDFTDDAIKELAKANLEKEALTKFKDGKEKEEQEMKAKADAKEAELAPFVEFREKYPDVKEFTPREAELMNKGISPIVAHELALEEMARQNEINEIKQKLNQAEFRNQNYFSSPGSGKSTTTEEGMDDFLSGFDAL